MTAEMFALYGLAVTIAFTHTILGPDHYLPFIAMSRAAHWTMRKTIMVTLLCGMAHVLSSVLIGIVGIALGISVLKLENIESSRGDLAGWMFIGFGLAYTVWGIRRALRSPTTFQAHSPTTSNPSLAPWILFTIFFFGPCEPLIPLLMFPAAQHHWTEVLIVSALFAVVTISTMTVVVLTSVRAAEGTSHFGSRLLGNFTYRFGHAVAGFVVLLCGTAIKFGL